MSKSLKKSLKNPKNKLRNKKQKGSGKLTLRCPNMDCGPPFHPQWQKMIGGKKLKQRGGDGQGNQGHDVSMPIQYYGQKLNRYFPAGSSELNPPNSAYGKTIATSHGVTINGNRQFVGPDLGPFNSSIGISGIQTGGGKKKKSGKKNQKLNNRKKSDKKSMNKKIKKKNK